jgi:ligand-binding sensor domain-containing protein
MLILLDRERAKFRITRKLQAMGLSKWLGVWGLLFLLAPTVLDGQTAAQPRPFRFNHLTVNEDLSHTDADDIVQDDKGFIWIATLFGLDRFDGYHVKRFYNRNEPFAMPLRIGSNVLHLTRPAGSGWERKVECSVSTGRRSIMRTFILARGTIR